jgi:hypothetical protein
MRSLKCARFGVPSPRRNVLKLKRFLTKADRLSAGMSTK